MPVEVRARASDRGRRLILVAIGLSAALSGAFAALAAGSTHPKKAGRLGPATRATAVSLPAPHATAPSATPPGGVQAAPLAPAEPPGGGDRTAGRDLGRLVTALHASAFEAIGTTARVVVTDPVALPAARALLVRELDELDRAASRFRSDSELVLLNQARGEARQVSPLLLEALSVAVRAAELTDGIVSPMVGRTLRLAGYDTTFALVAGRDGRRFAPKFAAVVDWRLLELDEERQTARIPPGVELDLGATAKALAADRAAATIARAAGCGALVSLGGDISVAGAVPPGAGQSASPTITLRRPTGQALRSRSRAAASPPRAPPPDAGARRAATCTTSSTPAPAGRLARRGGRSPSQRRRVSTRTPRAPRRSCSGRRRWSGWKRAAYRRASSPRTARPSAPAAGARRSHDTARGEQCEDALVPHPRDRESSPCCS